MQHEDFDALRRQAHVERDRALEEANLKLDRALHAIDEAEKAWAKVRKLLPELGVGQRIAESTHPNASPKPNPDIPLTTGNPPKAVPTNQGIKQRFLGTLQPKISITNLVREAIEDVPPQFTQPNVVDALTKRHPDLDPKYLTWVSSTLNKLRKQGFINRIREGSPGVAAVFVKNSKRI